MRRNLELLRRLISINIRGQMQHRFPFFVDVFGAFLVTITEFAAIALVLPRFENLGGWNLGEIAFLVGMINISFGFMDMAFSGFDPSYFGRHIRMGSLDQILLRPASVSLQVLGLDIAMRRLGRILMGAFILAFSLTSVNVPWGVGKSILLALTLISQIAYFGGLFMIGATITFWTIDSIELMNIFTYGGTELISYPMTIYPSWMQRFFTYILPAIFLNYFPALYILGKPDPYNFPAIAPWLAPIAGLFILVIAILFWRYGLSKYQSTGT